MRGGEAHIGEHVGFGFVHQRRELWQLGAQLVSDLAPPRARGRRVVLSEAVVMKAETTLRPLLPVWASAGGSELGSAANSRA